MSSQAQKVKLSDAIAYQDTSVVSKTLVNRPTGTVTLFAFAAGQGLSEHTAPFDALVYVVDGRANITIAGEAHVVEAGEMIVMPANAPHALQAVAAFKMLLILIKS